MTLTKKSSIAAMVLASFALGGQALAQPRGGDHGQGFDEGRGGFHDQYFSEFRSNPEYKALFDKVEKLHGDLFVEKNVLDAYVNGGEADKTRTQARKVIDLRKEVRRAHDELLSKLPAPQGGPQGGPPPQGGPQGGPGQQGPQPRR